MKEKSHARGIIKSFTGAGGKSGAVAATNNSAFELAIKGTLAVLAAVRVLLLAVQAMRKFGNNMHNRRNLYAIYRQNSAGKR